MAHPALVRFGGNLLGYVGAVGATAGTMMVASAGPAVATALAPLALPAAGIALAGAGAVWLVKRVSSRS